MTVPALPAGCVWVSDSSDAAAALAAGSIPLMRPPEPHRATRWAEVLGWYDPGGYAPPGARRGDVVVSVGACEELGQLVATALHRPHQHTAHLSEAATASSAVTSVLLVAATQDCSLAALAPALDAWSAARTRVGLLTGADAAGLTFSLAKILAAHTSPRTRAGAAGVAVLDGPAGCARRFPADTSQLRLADALAGEWLTMLIDAHGSNAHAWLGTHVLCGLSATDERTLAGHPIAGGCTAHRCKLSPDRTLLPAHPHELRCVLVGLFVCNAIALRPAEQYPSTVSLALDALDGYPAAVLGLLRGDADTTSLEPAVVAHLLHAGGSFGEVAWLLTQALAHRGNPHGVLLLGDPTQTAPAHSAVDAPAIPLDTSLDVPIVFGNHQPVPALITPGRALLAAPLADVCVVDAQPDADDLSAALRGWNARLAEARLMETALHTTSAHRGAAALLDALRGIREQATQVALGTLRHLEQLHRRRSAGLPPDPQPTLNELAERWASTVVTAMAHSPSALFSDLTEALTAHHHRTRVTPAGPCDHCGAVRHRLHYTGVAPVGNRTELRCPRCGLVRSEPDGATAVMLRTPPQLVPGQPATIECLLDGDISARCVLSVQLRTRSASGAAYASDTHVESPTGRTPVTLNVPPDTEPELHRAWAIAGCRFQLSLALARIPAIPTYDGIRTTRAKETM